MTSEESFLNLDKDKFRESQSKNVTLEDYLKVSEIEDEKTRNDVLGFVGTNNFEYQLKYALQEQEKRKLKQRVMAVLPDDVIICKKYDDLPEYNEREQLDTIYYQNKLSDERLSEIGKLFDDKATYYIYDNNYNMTVYKRTAPKNSSANTVDKEAEKRRQQLEERREKLKALNTTFFEMRKEFFESFKVTKQNLDKALQFCFMAIDNDSSFEYEVRDLCSLMDVDFYSEEELDELDEHGEFDYYGYVEEKRKECADKNINQALYLHSYLSLEDYDAKPYYDYNVEYYKNSHLLKVYKLLKLLGYQIADEEQKYIDGTHELYVKE